MHTASVVVLALVLTAVRSAFPAQLLYPWLAALAGTAAVALGIGLFVQRIRDRRAHRHGHSHDRGSRPRLAALALAGGLLPSPTAVLVLLGAFALGRAWFGLALVTAFGVGLAASLVVVGIAAMGARSALARWTSPRVVAVLPIASAIAVALLGGVVAAGGLSRL
jgi:ABC-type nickel/cobalt efflux system permease component RcnA